MAKGKLSDKQEAFCLELVRNGGNATQASLKAGYSPKNAASQGHENTKKPNIQKRLDELKAPAKAEKIMSIEKRREKLSEIAESEDSSDSDKMKAIDLLNRMDSLYLQRQEITGAAPVVLVDNVRE